MANRKISELSEIITVQSNIDVLPIVDISANTTKKITPLSLKFALELNNVDNTSDENKPISLAQQDALDSKIDKNSLITAGSAPKITFDSQGLVTSGDPLDEVDLPIGINANKIATGIVSNAEFEYLNGVTGNIQTAIDTKQDTLVSGTNIKTINSSSLLGSGDVDVQETLVSGTNIKTINSTSLLGSGDIAISASPAGVAGAIQFSDGSAFASDAANLFWDDTNNRLGVGTNAPSATTHIKGAGNSSATTSLLVQNSSGTDLINVSDNGIIALNPADSGAKWELNAANNYILSNVSAHYYDTSGTVNFRNSNVLMGLGTNAVSNTRLAIKGSGSTSATTALLVQNSAGTDVFKVTDDGDFGKLNPTLLGIFNIAGQSGNTSAAIFQNGTANFSGFRVQKNGQTLIDEGGVNAFVTSSAILELKATTKGFLPPKMTTTQKNAISSPASGLMVYDSTTNKLCCYNGSTWNDLF
jgi:hypothetical protein